jgi:hypothetical protein
VTLGPATGGEHQTPEGVPKDVLEESEEEPKMAPELVPEVVPEEVLAEGAMITACMAAPSPSRGAPAASGTGLEVVLVHPTPYAQDDIPLGKP